MSIKSDLLPNRVEDGLLTYLGIKKSGRTTVAQKLAVDIARLNKKKIFYSWSFEAGPTQNDQIMIVEPGESVKMLHQLEDEYGANAYANAANYSQTIYIVITGKQLSFSDLAIECLSVNLKKEINKTMLWVGESALGLVYLKKIDSTTESQLSRISENAKKEFFKSEIEKIYDSLNQSTDDLLRMIFVDKQIIFTKKLRKSENAIIPVKILVFGDVGSGKSTLTEILYAKMIKKYGKIHVNAWKHANDLGVLMHNFSGSKRKFVEYIVIEDATYQLSDDPILSNDWINIRHLVNERTGGIREDRRTGKQQGLVIAALCLHRLTGSACPPAYRTSFDFQFVMDVPTNKWDRDYVKALINDELLFDFLEQVSSKRIEAKKRGDSETYLSLLGIGVCISKQGVVPFRLHTSAYDALEIPLITKSQNWANTWQDAAAYLINKYQNMEKIPPNYVIDADITKYELDSFGRIRANAEGRINYRKVVINEVKSRIQLKEVEELEKTHMNYRADSTLESMQDLNQIMLHLLKQFAIEYNLEASMDDFLNSFSMSNAEQAQKYNKDKSTISGNIKRIRNKLYNSALPGVGFQWEQAIFILAYNLMPSKIVVRDQEGNIVQVSESLILRDYKLHRKYTYELHPLPAKNTPTNSPIILWLGGLSESDFVLRYSDRVVQIEAKASVQKKCDCVIERDFQSRWSRNLHCDGPP